VKIRNSDDFCVRINARLADLSYTFRGDEVAHTLAIAEGQEVRFPHSAGGRVLGGSSSWIAREHRDGDLHEPGMIATLVTLAANHPEIRTVLDVGALYGYVALVARSLFRQAEVHAFEANPRSFSALVNNIDANRDAFGDSVRAHHCALSDESVRQALVWVHGMRLTPCTGGQPVREKGSDFQVDMVTLDDFCREHALSPDLIKLDVEGYQAKIIPGALEVISRHRPVVLIEFDRPEFLNKFGVANREVIRPLMEDGYRLVWGMHRAWDPTFRVLEWSDLTDCHEMNSLGILVP
jgi:FkbM family methyltransferase